jgi:hypothetical protein
MMIRTNERRRPARRPATLATLAIGALGLVATLAPAALAQDPGTTQDEAPAAEGDRPPRPELTDEQKTCLEGQGVVKPEPDADGNRVKPTEEQRAAFTAAAEACGIELPAHGRGGPGGHRGPALTDEQKACLEEQGIEKPAKDADGNRVKPTDEQKAAFEAAAEACGIDLPERPADAPSDSAEGSGTNDESNSNSNDGTTSTSNTSAT